MATQAIQGRKGFLSMASADFGSTAGVEMTEVTDYTLTVEQPEADASSFDSSGWNEHVPVDRSWQLDFSIVATSANYSAGGTAAAWQWFIDGGSAGTNGSLRYLTLYPTTSATTKWVGRAVCSLSEIEGDMGDVMRGNFTFQGHGALTYTS